MTRCSQNKISAYHVHNSENIIMRLSGSRDETLKMTYGGSRRRSERTISLIFLGNKSNLQKGTKRG